MRLVAALGRVLLLGLLLSVLAAPEVGAATPVSVAVPLKTADGEKLIAAVYAAKSPNGVVLLHGAGGRKEEWASLAARLARSGLYVLSLDLRGHGLSTTAVPVTPADSPRMVEDVRAATAYLYSKGVKRVAFVGAELGANLAAAAAADDPAVACLVLLSAGTDIHGVLATPAVQRYGPRPVLLVASGDDPYGVRAARSLDAVATGDHQLLLYATAGKGTRMLAREPDLEPRIQGFVNTHWVAATAPATPTEITLQPTGLETTGP